MSKYSFLLFLSATLVMTSCDDDDDEEPTPTPSGPTQSIVEIASGSPDFSVLVAALGAGGLVDDLSGDGPFTVFAPDNDAFDAIFTVFEIDANLTDEEKVNALIAQLGAEAVINILKYHVIVGDELRAADITGQSYEGTFATTNDMLNELSILAEPSNGTVILNGGSSVEKGATVDQADILATNGVIHRIDAVLLLPTVADFARANSGLSTLQGALEATGLDETLADEAGTFTVFAPVNSGFEGVDLPADPTNVLLYHVLGEQLRSSQVVGTQTTLFDGNTIDIAVQADDVTVTITDGQGGTSNIVLVDIQGTNGVVHVIEDALIP
ncbi:MAG: fasciclin domain-containing protein [Bacteroidota bacterium]